MNLCEDIIDHYGGLKMLWENLLDHLKILVLLDAGIRVRFGSLWDYCGLSDASGDHCLDQGSGRVLELIGLS